ncbi:MAG: PAS domain-containing sensor histidine kinase [Bacteroidales bacterium]|jgi:signal transduction histidine kinase|nr:PAS domain-containing sensor histidine kinase [Bacteroidales bacterium]
MKRIGIDIDLLRNKVINSAIISIAILIFPVILTSTIRLFNHGWQSYFTVYLIELFCILFLFFTRNIITLKFKAHAVVIVSITFGLIGTSIFSLSGGNIQSIIGLLIITIVYGRRIGLYYAIIAILGYSLIGVLTLNGVIKREMDFNLFNYSFYPWLNAVALYSVIAFLIVYSIGLFYKYIIGSLKEVIDIKEELIITNNELIENKKNLEDKNRVLKELNIEYLNSQIKFKTIFDIVQVGISITDDKGNILDCNKSSNIILRNTREQHLQLNLFSREWNVLRGDNTPMPRDEFPGILAMKNNQPVSNVVMGILDENNNIIWINVDAIPLDIEGYGVVITFTDITEIQQTQEKLIKYSSELNLLNLDKDKFIKILAHDLKSPFTTLMGFSSLLLKNIYNYDIETIKEHLEVINDASSQTYEMLEEILIWLKSQSGQIIYNPKEIMFSEICDEVLNSINILAKDKNISLEFNCHSDDKNVYVDKNMTKTILRNLISNAIKFSKPNGKIKIIKEILDNETIITVSDQGIGISQEDINLIWNPLQTINSVGTSGEKGTGLGLSICKEFVEKQGGRIWVESKLSEGSNFKFTLPLAKKE